jgi:hypothetical protein
MFGRRLARLREEQSAAPFGHRFRAGVLASDSSYWRSLPGGADVAPPVVIDRVRPRSQLRDSAGFAPVFPAGNEPACNARPGGKQYVPIAMDRRPHARQCPRPMHPLSPRLAAGLVFALPAALLAQAGHEDPATRTDRRFTFVDESQHGAHAGEFEFENRMLWSRGTRNDPDVDAFAFKHEIEYGISQEVLFAVDFVEWSVSESGDGWTTKYEGTGAELKFRIADPRKDTVGFGFKTELGIGPRELEWENVLILDKVVGPWDVAYNFVLEAEFEGDKTFSYEEGELGVRQCAGVSYQLNDVWCTGIELVHEFPKEWSWGERQNFFVGPNVAIFGNGWAFTTTALFLADGIADAPEFQLQMLFEFEF